MKNSKFAEGQIAYALRQVEGGTSPSDVCRQLGVSEATFYIWKKKSRTWASASSASSGRSKRRMRA